MQKNTNKIKISFKKTHKIKIGKKSLFSMFYRTNQSYFYIKNTCIYRVKRIPSICIDIK